MPFIELQSNLPASSFPEDFVGRLSSCAAAALGKPEDRIKASFHHSNGRRGSSHLPDVHHGPRGVVTVVGWKVFIHVWVQMLIGGSCSPCVMLSVSAIGVTDTADKNKEHSAKIFEFLTKELHLTEDRIVIQFHALQPHQVGKKGTVMSFL
ncbi:D-dopachrome decarboxylase [Acanthopagrus schlegelii]